MYQHILLPTDGSELSTQAVRAGIRLAKSLGARVTALHTTPQFLIRPRCLRARSSSARASMRGR